MIWLEERESDAKRIPSLIVDHPELLRGDVQILRAESATRKDQEALQALIPEEIVEGPDAAVLRERVAVVAGNVTKQSGNQIRNSS